MAGDAMAAREGVRKSTVEAIHMHQSVDPSRWCVSRADLQALQRQVANAIQEGWLPGKESSSDESSPDSLEEEAEEEEFGPSIYTVNEHYIKPVTLRAGKMSWALMMHPEGLNCDVFVSHAWQEGIFEFLYKVFWSWPPRARHAWCCMLANPQHLNIGSMLLSPKTSPFALALQASRYVLVVPNRHRSVYTRLWCGYEAYVAAEKSKTIRIACQPHLHRVRWSLALTLVPLFLGIFVGLFGLWKELDMRFGAVVMSLASLASANMKQNRCWMVSNYIGLFASACIATIWIPLHKNDVLEHFFEVKAQLATMYEAALWFSAILFFFFAELDRIRSRNITSEGQQLRKDYQGSIRYASCSEPSDMRNIWEEIGSNVADVDRAISVLISAGTSSPALRSCAQRGIQIAGAAHAELAVCVVFLGPMLVVAFSQVIIISWHRSTYKPCLVIEAIGVLARFLFLVLFYLRPADERCFMLKVLTKLITWVLFPTALTVGILAGLEKTEDPVGLSLLMALAIAARNEGTELLSLFHATFMPLGTAGYDRTGGSGWKRKSV
ncbi:unnamed protein product [Durusdinium trenchii]|uniref:Uncharacterized protein n=2 Tax=Durusdinium trenchii TaxID=1381693 RepID=A0ABP0PZT3_9DINO